MFDMLPESASTFTVSSSVNNVNGSADNKNASNSNGNIPNSNDNDEFMLPMSGTTVHKQFYPKYQQQLQQQQIHQKQHHQQQQKQKHHHHHHHHHQHENQQPTQNKMNSEIDSEMVDINGAPGSLMSFTMQKLQQNKGSLNTGFPDSPSVSTSSSLSVSPAGNNKVEALFSKQSNSSKAQSDNGKSDKALQSQLQQQREKQQRNHVYLQDVQRLQAQKQEGHSPDKQLEQSQSHPSQSQHNRHIVRYSPMLPSQKGDTIIRNPKHNASSQSSPVILPSSNSFNFNAPRFSLDGSNSRKALPLNQTHDPVANDLKLSNSVSSPMIPKSTPNMDKDMDIGGGLSNDNEPNNLSALPTAASFARKSNSATPMANSVLIIYFFVWT
ncbi:unnamed protein product [[Candida] boidinii]|nr:unnamed protein product [[Candida] boidinii]